MSGKDTCPVNPVRRCYLLIVLLSVKHIVVIIKTFSVGITQCCTWHNLCFASYFFFFHFLKDNAWINCTTELFKKSLSSISRTVARSEEWQLNLPEHSLITVPTKMGFKAEDDWQGVLSPALPEDRKTHHLVPTRSSLNQATTRRLLSRNLQMPSPVNCMWACRTWSQSWISREHQRWLKGHRPYWGNKVESPQLHGGLTQQHSPSGDDARLKTVAGIREWRLKCNKWH